MTPEQELGRAQEGMRDLIARHWRSVAQGTSAIDLDPETVRTVATQIAGLLSGSGSLVAAADATRALAAQESPLLVAGEQRVLQSTLAERSQHQSALRLYELYRVAAESLNARLVTDEHLRDRSWDRAFVSVRVERTENPHVTE